MFSICSHLRNGVKPRVRPPCLATGPNTAVHESVAAVVPHVIRHGPAAPISRMLADFRCSVCGHKAASMMHPSYGQARRCRRRISDSDSHSVVRRGYQTSRELVARREPSNDAGRLRTIQPRPKLFSRACELAISVNDGGGLNRRRTVARSRTERRLAPGPSCNSSRVGREDMTAQMSVTSDIAGHVIAAITPI